ncbi:MAG: long-chain fatty acid--CoA ligase [Spirochaetes bacterium]|nr:long-chain fatty acid--CoA ligase [Spirochaetota bacterium]
MSAYKPYDDTTMPGIFRNQTEMSRDRIFVKIRDANKQWVEYSYGRIAGMVDALASYFLKKGIKPGDKIAIYSNNRPEWVVADLASLAIGAVDVTVYPTNSGPEASYILNDSESKICLCAGKFQVDNLLKEKKNLKNLKEIIVFDDLAYNDPLVVKFSKALDTGGKNLNLKEIDRRLRKIGVKETATLIYTSGTTGDPKGVMLTHDNLVSNVKQFAEHHPFPEQFLCVSLLPLSHALERTVGYNTAIRQGGTIAYTKGAETLVEDLKDIRPTLAVYVPRVLEKIYEGVMGQLANAPASKKKLFGAAMGVGKKALPYILSNRPIPFPLGQAYRLFDRLIYSKLRKALGLDRMVTIGIGGAPLSNEINAFFQAIGVEIHLGYGLTETTPITHLNTFTYLRPVKLGTCGPAFPRTECRIADDGEILVRGPQVMKGYYKKPKDTREVLSKDGWFATGDIGTIDADGYLTITDRKKDILITAGGKNVAPQVIEGVFTMHSLIEQIAIIGDQKKYLVALIVPAFPELIKWAKSKNIGETNPKQLIANPEVVKKFRETVEELNKPLGRVEQIKRFALIDRPFTQESGELTPTLKVKRKVVLGNYTDIIEEMYRE